MADALLGKLLPALADADRDLLAASREVAVAEAAVARATRRCSLLRTALECLREAGLRGEDDERASLAE